MSTEEVISVACDLERNDLNCMICQETVRSNSSHSTYRLFSDTKTCFGLVVTACWFLLIELI